MLFRWLKSRRRRRLLAEPFPRAWRTWLEDEVAVYADLPAELQSQIRAFVQIFVPEKHWEGLDGLDVTDEMRVTVAALAGLLVIGRPQELDFDHVLSILMYPDVFHARLREPNAVGVVSERREARIGEAWYRGPVILSWEDVWQDARRLGSRGNVVLHEFAHQLDMCNGRIVDGTPPLRSRAEAERWSSVMTREFEALRRRCRLRRPGAVDCYGTQDLAEFFAVATEAFFERSHALRAQSPELYSVLRDFYEVDPTEWTAGAAPTTD